MAPKKHRRSRRGSSKAGRPRKDGARHPGGRLKWAPPEPNARVVAERKANLGHDAAATGRPTADLASAENPMDLAHYRGWITERQHRAGAAFARIRAAAGLGAPGLAGGGLEESPEPSAIDKRPIAEMGRAEIVEAWDKAVALPSRDANPKRSENALRAWHEVCGAMTLAELAEVQLVCVHGSWPQWINWRCAEPLSGGLVRWLGWSVKAAQWEGRRDLLVRGLDKAAAAIFTGKDELEPALAREVSDMLDGGKVLNRRPGPVREEVTVYVARDAQEGDAPLYAAVRRVRPT